MTPCLRDILAELERNTAYLQAENDDLVRRIVIAEGAASPENREALQEAAQLRRLNMALKSQLAACQEKGNVARGIIRTLKRRIRELEEELSKDEDAS